jgi:ABC-type transporter Mla subunit MlaD
MQPHATTAALLAAADDPTTGSAAPLAQVIADLLPALGDIDAYVADLERKRALAAMQEPDDAVRDALVQVQQSTGAVRRHVAEAQEAVQHVHATLQQVGRVCADLSALVELRRTGSASTSA